MDEKVPEGAEAEELSGQDVGMTVYMANEVNRSYDGSGIEDGDKDSNSRIFRLPLRVREAASTLHVLQSWLVVFF